MLFVYAVAILRKVKNALIWKNECLYTTKDMAKCYMFVYMHYSLKILKSKILSL